MLGESEAIVRPLVLSSFAVVVLVMVCSLSPMDYRVRRASAGAVWQQDSPLIGDVNGDCSVNALDFAAVSRRFLVGIGSLLYSPRYDLNGDGVINIFDIQTVAAHFLQHC